MRIIQIGCYLMGAQKTMEEGIHKYAVDNGHSSRILYIRGESNLDSAIRCETRFENLVTRILRKWRGKNPSFAKNQTKRIIREIRSYKPDIIHLHVVHSGCIDYRMLFRFLVHANIPVVYTMHDMWAQTGGCYHYFAEKCNGFMNGCDNCPAKQMNLDVEKTEVQKEFALKKELLLGIKDLRCVTVSRWVEQEFRKGYLREKPITVIHNGVYDPEIYPLEITDQSMSEEVKKLICIAMFWNKGKGIDTILDMARQIGDGYEIHLVGHVNDSIRVAAPSNVVFHGFCSDKEKLLTLLQKSDLHVTASLEETFGMTLVEAALVGIRSVGYASTAINETIRLVHGVAVDEFTTEALLSAVKTLIEQNANRLSREEIEKIRETFSIEKMAQKYFDVYNNARSN